MGMDICEDLFPPCDECKDSRQTLENSKNSQLKITLFLILKIHKCINKYVGVSKEGIG